MHFMCLKHGYSNSIINVQICWKFMGNIIGNVLNVDEINGGRMEAETEEYGNVLGDVSE